MMNSNISYEKNYNISQRNKNQMSLRKKKIEEFIIKIKDVHMLNTVKSEEFLLTDNEDEIDYSIMKFDIELDRKIIENMKKMERKDIKKFIEYIFIGKINEEGEIDVEDYKILIWYMNCILFEDHELIIDGLIDICNEKVEGKRRILYNIINIH